MLWFILVAGLTCILLILLSCFGGLLGFFGISDDSLLTYARNGIPLMRVNGKKEKLSLSARSLKDTNSSSEISENEHQEFVESLRSVDTSGYGSCDSPATLYEIAVPVQPIPFSKFIPSSPYTFISLPFFVAYQSQRDFTKPLMSIMQSTSIIDDKDEFPESDHCSEQGIQDQLSIIPNMVLEMRLCEKTGVILGMVKHLNIPRDQRLRYPEEVCFRVTKLPILQDKQLVYKTMWKEYTSSLVNLTFRLSGMKSTDSIRIRLYGRCASSAPKEICHGERVIHMKDISFGMSSCTHDLLPKSKIIMEENIKRAGHESGYCTPSLTNSNDY